MASKKTPSDTSSADTPSAEPPVFSIKSEAFEDSPLAEVYYNLINEIDDKGKKMYSPNVALWAAWEAHRSAATVGRTKDWLKALGLPKTRKEFATLIGVSDRTIRKYARDNPELSRMAQNMSANRVLAEYRLPVLHALGKSASSADYKHAPDRRTFLTMTGDLVDRQDITTGGESVAPRIYLPDNGRH